MNLYKYREFLESKGVKNLGSGCYGCVYQHPTLPNVVAKIYDYDDAYDHYINWCTKNQKNPYVPKIYSIHKCEKFTIVFLEKLEEVSLDLYEDWEEKTFPRHLKHLLHNPSKYKKENDLLSNPILKRDKNLKIMIEFLIKVKNLYRIDLHDGNIMLRGEQIVITDPIAPD